MGFKTEIDNCDMNCYRCENVICACTNYLKTNDYYNRYYYYCVGCAKEKGYTVINLKPFDEGRKGSKVIEYDSYDKILPPDRRDWNMP